MARSGRLGLLAAAAVVVNNIIVLPSHVAFTGARSLCPARCTSSQCRVGMRAASESDCVVFVDNLAWGLERAELMDHMSQAGAVVNAGFLKKVDGKPKRAFVVYETAQGAEAAIEKLHETELGERPIRVIRKPVKAAPGCVVFVDNLKWHLPASELADHMSQAGKVVNVRFLRKITGRPQRAIIEYETPHSAEAAIENLHGTELGERPIRVLKRRAQAAPAPGCGVYVDNLDWHLKQSKLEEHMSQAGEVVNVRFLPRITGRPKRAIIEYKTPQSAEAAIETLHGTELGGRPIRVLKKSLQAADGCEVFVHNLDWRLEQSELEEHMSQAGEVVSIKFLKRVDGKPKRAIVAYNTPQDAECAIEKLHETELGERSIHVVEKQDKVRAD